MFDSLKSRWKALGRKRAPLLLEARAVRGLAEELAPQVGVLEVEGGGAGAELLEDDEVHAVGPQVEDLRKGLPFEVGP